jgi:Ca2+-binding RTX toxin-like protein
MIWSAVGDGNDLTSGDDGDDVMGGGDGNDLNEGRRR